MQDHGTREGLILIMVGIGLLFFVYVGSATLHGLSPTSAGVTERHPARGSGLQAEASLHQ